MYNFSDIPIRLKELPNWVVWKKEKRNGKLTKVPYDAKKPEAGLFAKSNDATTWSSFDAAFKAADPLSGNDFDGVGFMLHGTNLVGIDFDGVVDDGVPEPYVLNLISQLSGAYCEITPSLTGLRVFVECDSLPVGNRKFSAKKKGIEKYGAEIYSGGEGGRYLTVTGARLSGKDIPKIKDLSLFYFLVSKFPDEHFKKLWLGDSSDYENDDSRVDLALLGTLARACRGDKEKAIQLFNASVPGHREKWVNRADYRDMTIRKAFDGMSVSEKIFNAIVNQNRKDIEFKVFPSEETKEKWTSFDFVVAPMMGQFDGWFPLGSPSLVGGSSGSGKTTFMLDLCVKQALGVEFYGHQTYKRPYLVLMLDRGRESHERTMKRLGFSMDQVPIRFIKAAVDGDASQEIINQIEADPENIPGMIFIEGMDMLVSDPSAMEVVMPFMHEIQQIATHFHTAIVGSVGAPKSKPKDAYTAKRDTIFGSAVWSRMSETIVTIQFPAGDDTADQRSISVLPRNAKSEKFDTEFQEGKLVVIPSPVEEEYTGPTKKEHHEQEIREQAQSFIVSYLQDGPKNTDDVVDAAKELYAINTKTLADASADLFRRGIIQKTQEVVETAQSRASQFILRELAAGPKRGAEVYLIGIRVEGFSRKTLEEVSAELAAFGQIRKTNGKDAVWSLVPNAEPMPSAKTGITKWVWSIVSIDATKDSVKSDDMVPNRSFDYEIS
jgi:AAA domain